VHQGKIDEWPLTEFAAVSVGWLGENRLLLDLNYSEDENAWADLTVVATQSGDIIEIHGAGEGRAVPKTTYQQMLELGLSRIPELVRQVHGQLKNHNSSGQLR